MEHDNNHQPQRGRETLLTIMLTLFGGVVFLFFLVMVTGGFFLYVALAVVAIAAVGAAHYVLWGQSMTQEVEQEKEEMPEEPLPKWKGHKRF